MTTLEHLSYSSISAYLSCGHYWQMKYIDKLPTGTSPELVFGSAFHGTIENFIKGNHQGDLLQFWQTNWKEQLERNPEIDWGMDSPASFENLGIRMFESKEIHQGILSIKADAPEWIEKRIELKVPGVPIPVLGFIDIVTADGIPGDFKTSSKSWTMDKALGETQPLFYLAALNQLGIHSHNWKFRHFVFVKTKEPKFQIMEHVHNPTEVFWLFEMIRRAWQGIEAGVFPISPGSWKCSPNYCEFWSKCRGKNGR